ncbi:MAG: hypothetical protein AB1540_04860 [Bdellovibrionota bacterium]
MVTSQELVKALGSRVAIKRKADAGELVSLGSGLYASPSIDPFIAAVVATARHYPKAVISSFTALVLHKLSDEAISQIDVDIEKSSMIRNRLLRVHRVTKSRLTGITSMKFQGDKIKIYDVERTLCEAYKLDPAGPVFFKALKRYLKTYPVKPEAIHTYDKALGTQTLLHLQQELADA